MNELFTPEDDRKISKELLSFFSFLSIFIGIVVLIFFIHKVSELPSLSPNEKIQSLTNYGSFGDYIAGVVGTFFSLGGFFMLYLTLRDQRDNFHRERLESNFFEMIKIHRENVNEMQCSNNDFGKMTVTAEKRKVFRIIFSQFNDAWKELNHIFERTDISEIYEAQYLNKIQSNNVITDRKIDLREFAQIDIVYSIIFFGLSKEDRQTIKKLFENKYKKDLIT